MIGILGQRQEENMMKNSCWEEKKETSLELKFEDN